MRRRMREELSLAAAGSFDIKQDPGGIADIEFLVDYWVLAALGAVPGARRVSRQHPAAGGARSGRLVPEELCSAPQGSYLALRQRVHELALDEGGRVVPEPELAAVRDFVSGVWAEVFERRGRRIGPAPRV